MLTALLWGPATSVAGDDNADAEYRAGREAMRAGNPETAADAFERAVRIDPGFAPAWLNLGIARARVQDWEGAVAAYESLIELDPGHAKALNNMANVYFRQGRHDQAALWYERALAADPDYLLASFHFGWVLRELNRPDEAEKWFSHCLSIEPDTDRERKTRLDCLFYLGALRFRARDYERAASILERVVAVQAVHPEARYYLGMSYRQLGRLDEARTQLEIHGKMVQAIRRSEPVEKQPDP